MWTMFLAEDIKQKISELNGLANEIQDGAVSRDAALTEALDVSEKFHDLCGEVMSNLRDLKDNMISQEPPGVDPMTVKEQQKELKVVMATFTICLDLVMFYNASNIKQSDIFYLKHCQTKWRT